MGNRTCCSKSVLTFRYRLVARFIRDVDLVVGAE